MSDLFRPPPPEPDPLTVVCWECGSLNGHACVDRPPGWPHCNARIALARWSQSMRAQAQAHDDAAKFASSPAERAYKKGKADAKRLLSRVMAGEILHIDELLEDCP